SAFQSWQHDSDEHDPSSIRDSSWFRGDFRASEHKGGRSRNKGQHQQRGFQFFEDDDIEIETIFRSAFGGNRYYYWSFINEEPQWRNSSSNFNSHRWNWRHQYSDYDESTNSDNSESDLSSERLTLGLNAFGPLNLEDVKNAYRLCALKWHPDRHQDTSKVYLFPYCDIFGLMFSLFHLHSSYSSRLFPNAHTAHTTPCFIHEIC
ncbi:hypothetical protein FXO37_23721, partial [Capsicum annuum]